MAFKLFGVNEISARIPNMLFIVLTAGVTYLLGMSLSHDRRVAALTGLSTLVSGRYDIMVRNETGAILFFATFLLCVLRFEQTSNRWWLIGAGVAAGLAAMQRFELAAMIPLFLVYLIARQIFLDRVTIFSEPRRYLVHGLKKQKTALVFAGVALFVFSPMMFYNARTTGTPWNISGGPMPMNIFGKYSGAGPQVRAEQRFIVFGEDDVPTIRSAVSGIGLAKALEVNERHVRSSILQLAIGIVGPIAPALFLGGCCGAREPITGTSDSFFFWWAPWRT